MVGSWQNLLRLAAAKDPGQESANLGTVNRWIRNQFYIPPSQVGISLRVIPHAYRWYIVSHEYVCGVNGWDLSG
jgi:hypothetical protein